MRRHPLPVLLLLLSLALFHGSQADTSDPSDPPKCYSTEENKPVQCETDEQCGVVLGFDSSVTALNLGNALLTKEPKNETLHCLDSTIVNEFLKVSENAYFNSNTSEYYELCAYKETCNKDRLAAIKEAHNLYTNKVAELDRSVNMPSYTPSSMNNTPEPISNAPPSNEIDCTSKKPDEKCEKGISYAIFGGALAGAILVTSGIFVAIYFCVIRKKQKKEKSIVSKEPVRKNVKTKESIETVTEGSHEKTEVTGAQPAKNAKPAEDTKEAKHATAEKPAGKVYKDNTMWKNLDLESEAMAASKMKK